MDRTEENAPKRRERPRRQINSHFLPKPLSKEADLAVGRALGAKITVRMDPSPSLLGGSVNDFECFGRKTKILNRLQFSIFRLSKTKRLSHATDCNIVGKVKLPLSFIFLFIVDKIKVKI